MSVLNLDGVTHRTLPFMFHLTVCGLKARRRRAGSLLHKHRTDYDRCKWCYPQERLS